MDFSKFYFKSKAVEFQKGACHSTFPPIITPQGQDSCSQTGQEGSVTKATQQVLGKSGRNTPERWVFLPTGWHPWTIKCLSTATFNNGYLTFWLLNCRKYILTQVLLHFNLTLTGKHQLGHDPRGAGLAPENVRPTGLLTVFSASLTPAISDLCSRAGFVYSSSYRGKECFGFFLYIHIYSSFWGDSSFLRLQHAYVTFFTMEPTNL